MHLIPTDIADHFFSFSVLVSFCHLSEIDKGHKSDCSLSPIRKISTSISSVCKGAHSIWSRNKQEALDLKLSLTEGFQMMEDNSKSCGSELFMSGLDTSQLLQLSAFDEWWQRHRVFWGAFFTSYERGSVRRIEMIVYPVRRAEQTDWCQQRKR